MGETGIAYSGGEWEAAGVGVCPTLLCVVVVNTTAKNNLVGGKGLFQLTFSGHSPSRREVRAGTEGGGMEECCLLTCWFILS